MYRVSQKKRPNLVLQIYQLSRGLKIPSWTFFNSPLRVESKNVHFFWCVSTSRFHKITDRQTMRLTDTGLNMKFLEKPFNHLDTLDKLGHLGQIRTLWTF